MAKNKKKRQQEKRLNTFQKFLERLTEMVGPSLFREMERTFVQRPTTFRVNTLKATKQEVRAELERLAFKTKNVIWYADAFILQNKTKRELTETELYTSGKIYIQSLASMAPPIILDPKPGEKILDLTAAPGSKTSQIAMMMERKGELVANDSNKVRFFKLKHNVEALGVAEVSSDAEFSDVQLPPEEGKRFERIARIENEEDEGYAKKKKKKVKNEKKGEWTFTLRLEHGAKLCEEFPEYFDKILLDAPCSAEARFIDGEPKTTGYWKEQKVKEMAYKQRQLLFAAWQALKPGGILVYSTCTFSPEENEMQISKLIERYPDGVELIDTSITGLKRLPSLLTWREKAFSPHVKKTFRIFPTTEIEGFFVAKLKKK